MHAFNERKMFYSPKVLHTAPEPGIVSDMTMMKQEEFVRVLFGLKKFLPKIVKLVKKLMPLF